MITQEELNKAVDSLKTAIAVVADEQSKLTGAKVKLAESEAKHLRDGVEGSNQALRDAALLKLTTKETDEVRKAEESLALAKLAFTLADLEWSRVKWTIRLTHAFDEAKE